MVYLTADLVEAIRKIALSLDEGRPEAAAIVRDAANEIVRLKLVNAALHERVQACESVIDGLQGDILDDRGA
jgi:hypothetical protein